MTTQSGGIAISIVICCFNSAKRLPRTLQHLLSQKQDDDIQWQVIVVDNASTDNTAAIARETWPSNARIPLRVLAEPRPGLSNARRCGYENSAGEVICYVDDDNWVSEDWVCRVRNIFASHPDVGACGGRGSAVFETTEPEWFSADQDSFAVGPQAVQTGYVPDARGYLVGAGLAIRRIALDMLYKAGFEQFNEDRVGRSLSSCGDVELCLALRLAGWRLYYDSQLEYAHFIPATRLRRSYRYRHLFASGRAEASLMHYRAILDSPTPLSPHHEKRRLFRESYWVARNLLRMLRHFARANSNEERNWPHFFFRSGVLWGLISSGRDFERNREKVHALWQRVGTR